MRTVRIILAILAALFAVLMGYVTLTVPAIAATAPAIFTVRTAPETAP